MKSAIARMKLAIQEFLYQLYWQLIRVSWKVLRIKENVKTDNKQYSIGITTYLDRYENLFIPFLIQLVKIFPDTEIVVAVNGHYNKKAQMFYLKNVHSLLKQFKNVKVLSFVEAQGLSKLWNLLLLNSINERFIICNDDLEISPFFRRDLERSGILAANIALINKSWSHFLITKETINSVGWFDERFTAIGNEDEDYESRLVLKKRELSFFHFRSIRAIPTLPLTYSYGPKVEIVNHKYLKSNKMFFDAKWEIAAQPTEGYHYVRILNAWVKLREGMDTPQFYN